MFIKNKKNVAKFKKNISEHVFSERIYGVYYKCGVRSQWRATLTTQQLWYCVSSHVIAALALCLGRYAYD